MTTAHHAIKAAQNVSNWGPYAARKYAYKRGVSPAMYRLARQYEARKGV